MEDSAMSGFKIHDVSTAPEDSRAILETLQGKVGFVPNVFGLIANSPVALDALVAVNACFEATSFTPAEREIISLATSVENQCRYCVAGHSTFAVALGVSPVEVEAIRSGKAAEDQRLEALRHFTSLLLQKKGEVSTKDIEAFLGAGFEEAHIFELLIGIIAKVMTNFASKLARIPVDDAFADHAWVPTTDMITDKNAA
jgi:uncharacterized peroxidase-related enzyme